MTKSNKASNQNITANNAIKSTSTSQAMRIIKAGNCSTISGKSSLHYHIACNDEGAIYIRVSSNNGGGFFNPEWVAYAAIVTALEATEAITSPVLRGVFQGRSANNPAFMMSVLLQEGIVIAHPEQQRAYQLADTKVFTEAMQKLIQSDIAIQDSLGLDEMPSFIETKAA